MWYSLGITRNLKLLQINSLLTQTTMHNMYVNQFIQIKWNSIILEKCVIANGVKQGRVLFSILFGIFIDNLMKRLKDSNIDCK